MFVHFCIEKGVIGTKKHLIYENAQISWDEKIPDGVLVFSNSFLANNCIKSLCKIEGIDFESLVPNKFITSMKNVMKDEFVYENVPWQKVLPPQIYRFFLLELVKKITKALDGIDTRYFDETFSSVSSLFKELDYAAINVPKLHAYLENPETVNPHTLKTFKPIAGSFARKVEYNRFASRTGRLTVSNGPDILTLKREFRDVIVSRFKGGSLRYVDFSSLEARVLLAASGDEIVAKDIYTSIRDKLIPSKSRDITKLIVLATVFGSGRAGLLKLSGLKEKKLEEVQEKIREIFNVSAFEKKLQEEFQSSHGYIRNAFGRRVIVNEERTLINSFVQSTGVDVSLLGFQKVVNEIKNCNLSAKPIFILHDALIIDTPKDEIESLDAIAAKPIEIPKMKIPFFFDVKDLYTSA